MGCFSISKKVTPRSTPQLPPSPPPSPPPNPWTRSSGRRSPQLPACSPPSPPLTPPLTPPQPPQPARRQAGGSSSRAPVPAASPWARGNWRSGAKPLSAPSTSVPSYDSVELGHVVKLPKVTDTSSIIHVGLAQGGDQEPWDHPAVITGKFEKGGEQYVRIRLTTSFGGRTVEARKPSHQRRFFILADNAEDQTPHSGTVLASMKAGSARFVKRTYVNLSRNSEYVIEYKHLTTWAIGHKQMTFDAVSTKRIIACQVD
ncbi:hypothetical protein P153DRAFT_295815 [Dothidotthia symphoricarpi CBS 119687]|uniref:Uncharacterized protein n=1 Tax=Dothidotthia symphoricarpi CBS 119687 TaxID=1392245 RepID=A0A6A6A5T0_9PLEO|nr:uncharacterized protein P153DRAFT_295815 [Dothidotthia symphoricarpi CBS 119687]KAF2127180.1 hypothetical protein P153DRAFT_295815 [Dothidotthia symphoricarpi CBS 119687]